MNCGEQLYLVELNRGLGHREKRRLKVYGGGSRGGGKRKK